MGVDPVSSGDSYDAAGDRTQITWPDGGANALAVQYAYDNLRRVTSITENGSYALAGYTYDALGRRTAISRGPSGSLAGTGYAYDGADRLSQLTQTFASSGNNLTLGITPSPSDQIATRSVSNAAYAYTPPAPGSASYAVNSLNQYSVVAGTSYAYDLRGNLTSDGTRAFTYDLDNRLLSASAPTAVSLSYDPLGRLQTSTAAGVTTNFLYDGDALVAEYDNSGNILRRYVPGPGVDEPAVWYEGAGTSGRRWLHADDAGSIIAWSDTSANAQATYGYGPYGEQATWSGSRYRYTGQLMIPEAHLYNYKARVYDPGLGRFLQTDPAGYASDMNAYAYAGGDPVNGRDSDGLGGCDSTPPDSPTGPATVAELVVCAARPDPDPPYTVIYISGPTNWNSVPPLNISIVHQQNLPPQQTSPQSNQPKISCSSRLPNGKTVGDMVQQLNQRIAQSEDEGNGLSGALTFFQGVNTGGILDFKNTMRGQGFSGSYLAAAGNFAYGAAGADYFGNNPVGAQIIYFGGTVYAGTHLKANIIPPGTIFPQDASGAANIGAGFKSGGC